MTTYEPRSGYVTANGIRLHYLDRGGTGAPIVLLHGQVENPPLGLSFDESR